MIIQYQILRNSMTSNLRILIIGKVKFTESILNELITKGFKISGVICGENKGINSDFVDLSLIAKKNNISFHSTDDINSGSTLAWVEEKKPDVIFCLGWPQLIKKELLSLPKKYIIGYHPSDLPFNKGRHPIIWSLVLGLSRTASCFFLMDEGADTGQVISKKFIAITKKDKAADLYFKIESAAKKQIIKIIKDISHDKLKPLKFDTDQGNSWRKRSENDGLIDWRMTAESIYNLVRALSHPYEGAHFLFDSKPYKVYDSEISPKVSERNIEPGKINSIKNGSVEIQCGKGSIILKKIEPSIDLTGKEYL